MKVKEITRFFFHIWKSLFTSNTINKGQDDKWRNDIHSICISTTFVLASGTYTHCLVHRRGSNGRIFQINKKSHFSKDQSSLTTRGSIMSFIERKKGWLCKPLSLWLWPKQASGSEWVASGNQFADWIGTSCHFVPL